MAGARGNTLLRAADKYGGIPLIAAAGLVKRKRPLPDDVRRIGVVNATNMGDTVVLSAVLSDIARARPEAEVLLFAGGTNATLAPLLPDVTAVPIELFRPRQAIAALRAQRLDVLLDFDSWPRVEPVYAIFSGARWTAGFKAPGAHRHFAFDRWVPHRPKTHELDNYRALATVLGVASTSVPSLTPPGLLDDADRPDGPYVVLHLWPSGLKSHLKQWPQARWAALARALVARGRTVVLTGGPADVEPTRAFARTLADLPAGAVVDTAGRFGLGPVMDLLAGAEAVVSVNTGVMHLAAATGVPTVSLNGPTDPVRWGPVGPRTTSVNPSCEGCGYLYYGWEYDGQREDCMDHIEVERVLDATLGALEPAA